jgi:methionyl-tRNA formyltransferase
MVRAYDPWPGTFVETEGGRIAVWRATPDTRESGDEPGVLVAHEEGIAMTTIDGRLVLEDVQPAGGRRMPGAAFRRGRPGSVGSRVVEAAP